MVTRRNITTALLGAAAGACLAPLAACSSLEQDRPAMAIDCHAHVFLRGLPMPDRRRAPSGYDAAPEAYLHVLDAHAMTHGVLVQPSFLGADNSYLIAALRRHPDRLRGIAVVEPGISVHELDALQRAGVAGIRLNLIGLPTPDFAAPAWQALLQEIRRRHWQVEVHQLAALLPAVLEPLLRADVNVVVDHFGRPDPVPGIDDPGFRYLLSLAPARRVWVKLSAAYRNGLNGRGEEIARAAVPLLRRHFGVDRLLWGSDWPHTLFEDAGRYARQLRLLEAWLPDAGERRAVLADTPARLFSFQV